MEEYDVVGYVVRKRESSSGAEGEGRTCPSHRIDWLIG